MIATGETVSHYRILEKLGSGGMGVVYRAEDTKLHREVALKFLPEEFTRDRQALERFHREAYAASALNHPNICTIHDIDEHAGQPFIVMELLKGRTLKDWLAEPRAVAGSREPLSAETVLDLTMQIADALEAAHSQGIIHRDIKPANVMVTERGQAKIMDFGLAKLAHEGTPEAAAVSTQNTATRSPVKTSSSLASLSASLSRAGLSMGTPAYMSPEQVVGKDLDQRTDLFSLGLVLYEMATGRRAFEAETPEAVAERILIHIPPLPSRVNHAWPPAFDEIIRKLLEKDRELRYQTIAEMRVDLARLRRDMESGPGSTRPELRHLIKGRSFPYKWEAFAALMILAVGLVGVVWSWVHRSGSAPTAPMTAAPLTSYGGRENMPSFSPDGSQVTFSWNGEKEDNFDIYVKLIGAETPLRLTTNPADDFSPAWSPDGRRIAFLRALADAKAAVILISPIGGPERIVTEIYLDQNNVEGPYLAWSPDSRWLAIAGFEKPDEVMGLFLYSVENGGKRRLTSPPDNGKGDGCPAFSPDGRTLAFFRWASWWSSDLYLLELSKDFQLMGEPKQLTFGNWRGASPAWTTDGKDLIFSALSGGESSLWRVAASGASKPQRLPFGENGSYPAISRRENRLTYTQSFTDSNIWRAEIPAPGEKAKPPERLISSTRNEYFPEYSPDGKKVAFVSMRSGSQEIWVCDADGSNAVKLTSSGGPSVGRPRWSPDGRQLAFTATIEGHKEVYVLNASGGAPQRLTSNSSGSANPSWSSDGRWIYFDTQIQRVEIRKVPVSGGPAALVTDQCGWGPVESPDGQFIYSAQPSADHPALLRFPAKGGACEQVLDSSKDGISYSVARDGIYFVPKREPKSGDSIQFLNTTTRNIRRIATIEKPVDFGLTVSPDRRWILYTQADQAGSDLMLVEDFR